jgi:hypothetical protein
MDEPVAPEEAAKKKQKKKKDKVRSAWISFVGRILAQVVGAVATVALGLAVLHKHVASENTTPPAGSPGLVRAAVSPGVARPGGEVVIAVLQLENPAGDRHDDRSAKATLRSGRQVRITAQLVEDPPDQEPARPAVRLAARSGQREDEDGVAAPGLQLRREARDPVR